jgi:hypothetical protein
VTTALADGIAEMARRRAASMRPDEFVARFTVTAPQVVAGLRTSRPFVIEYFGNGTFPIDRGDVDRHSRGGGARPRPVRRGRGAGKLDSPRRRCDTVGMLASVAEPLSFIEAATGRTSTAVQRVLP